MSQPSLEVEPRTEAGKGLLTQNLRAESPALRGWITMIEREAASEALRRIREGVAGLRELSDAATPGPWVESRFRDSPQYAHMGEAWKDEKRREEGKLIRGGGRMNPVAMALQSDEDKALIVAAVNYIRSLLIDTEIEAGG